MRFLPNLRIGKSPTFSQHPNTEIRERGEIVSHLLNTGKREVDIHGENSNILCHFCLFTSEANFETIWLLKKGRRSEQQIRLSLLCLSHSLDSLQKGKEVRRERERKEELRNRRENGMVRLTWSCSGLYKTSLPLSLRAHATSEKLNK